MTSHVEKLTIIAGPFILPLTLHWRHNECDGVSNHQRLHCLLKCWFRRGSKKTSKLRVAGLCVGNSPVTGEFPAQKASNAETGSIWWRHEQKLPLIILGFAISERRVCCLSNYDKCFEGKTIDRAINILGLRHNGGHISNILDAFFNENICLSIPISLIFVLKSSTDNRPALARVMNCHLTGYKPLPGPMVTEMYGVT